MPIVFDFVLKFFSINSIGKHFFPISIKKYILCNKLENRIKDSSMAQYNKMYVFPCCACIQIPFLSTDVKNIS